MIAIIQFTNNRLKIFYCNSWICPCHFYHKMCNHYIPQAFKNIASIYISMFVWTSADFLCISSEVQPFSHEVQSVQLQHKWKREYWVVALSLSFSMINFVNVAHSWNTWKLPSIFNATFSSTLRWKLCLGNRKMTLYKL